MKQLLITIAAVLLVGCGESKDILLYKAAEQGDLKAVKYYLTAGSNKNFKHGLYNDTPLHRAVFSEHEKVVIYLVSSDVDINALDYLGTTPLDDAYEWGNKKIINLIRIKGGKTGSELGVGEVSSATIQNIRKPKQSWGHFLILSLFSPIVAICCFVTFYKNRSIHMRLKSTGITPINFLYPGCVEVSGRAESNEECLISPWGKTECLYYKFLVEKFVSSGDSGGSWKTYLNKTKFVPFTINDDTGKVKIDKTKGVDFVLHTDNEFKAGNTNMTTDLRELLKIYKAEEPSFLSQFRFTEKTIYPYEELYVFGNAEKSADGWLLGRKQDIPLIISNKGEASVQKKFWNQKYVSLTIMIISILGTLFGLRGLFINNMWITALLLLIYIILITLITFLLSLNKTKNSDSRKNSEENDLFQLCQTIISSGVLTTDSVRDLAEYINNMPDPDKTWPSKLLIKPLKKTWNDGIVDDLELSNLSKVLESIVRKGTELKAEGK